MKAQRRIIRSVGVGVVVAACLPAVGAQANPLLSGYGGPGQGNQAILGAKLLNGPGGGGGSGAVSAASSNGEGASGNSTATASTPSGSAPRAGAGGSARAHQRRAPAARRSLDPESTYRALERSANVSSDGSLGLSGSEVALAIVALAALALLGALTRWAARARPAKGHD
jgi:hypothetical protein